MAARPDEIPVPPTPAAALMEGGLKLGLPLSSHTVARLVLYLQDLQRWNANVNLTGPASERDLISKHFLDSLAALTVIKPDAALIRPGRPLSLLDVGTGAGFPGLVLKVQDPDLAVTLVEPSQKKAAFLHHMIGTLGLTGVTVLIARLEDLQPDHGPFDLITTRALRAELVLAKAPRLLAPGGQVLLFRTNWMDTAPAGYRIVREESFTLPFTDAPRTLTLLAPIS